MSSLFFYIDHTYLFDKYFRSWLTWQDGFKISSYIISPVKWSSFKHSFSNLTLFPYQSHCFWFEYHWPAYRRFGLYFLFKKHWFSVKIKFNYFLLIFCCIDVLCLHTVLLFYMYHSYLFIYLFIWTKIFFLFFWKDIVTCE